MKAALFALFVLIAILALTYAESDVINQTFTSEEIEEHGRLSTKFFESRKMLQAAEAEVSATGVTLGVDISTLVSTQKFQCLKSSGYAFAIPRGYRSLGDPDPNVIANLNNAQAAGIKYRDFYVFPCPKCSRSGSGQVQQAYNNVKGRASFGMIWLDIEGPQYWTTNHATNRAFFESLLSGCKAVNAHCGVYTNKYMWQTIFGADYTGGSSYPLWWAYYDYKAAWTGWSTFGGWGSPRGGFMKQFSDKGSACQVSYDISFY